MFLDASAIIALLLPETDAGDLTARLDAQGTGFHVSPLVRFEAIAGLARARCRDGSPEARQRALAQARAAVDALIEDLACTEIPITTKVGEAALEAAGTYGKMVGHPAQLNFGDCFAYACARSQGLTLLYKGSDFARTDLG
jgi:ribonuclease VapC